METQNELIAYSLDFASYLILKLKNIDRIILYGSVARNDFDEKSDVDLFVDTKEKINKKLDLVLDKYYKTRKFKEWQLKGIERDISCISGELDSDEWKDLKRSIINTGIILYGKYKSEAEKINQYVLFSFENIKPDKKRVSVFRSLFGFKTAGKKYAGIAEKIGAVRIAKGSLLVPTEKANELKKFFQNKKISVKLYDLWSDVKLS
jgi:predicted nucleotidyltransferase